MAKTITEEKENIWRVRLRRFSRSATIGFLVLLGATAFVSTLGVAIPYLLAGAAFSFITSAVEAISARFSTVSKNEIKTAGVPTATPVRKIDSDNTSELLAKYSPVPVSPTLNGSEKEKSSSTVSSPVSSEVSSAHTEKNETQEINDPFHTPRKTRKKAVHSTPRLGRKAAVHILSPRPASEETPSPTKGSEDSPSSKQNSEPTPPSLQESENFPSSHKDSEATPSSNKGSEYTPPPLLKARLQEQDCNAKNFYELLAAYEHAYPQSTEEELVTEKEFKEGKRVAVGRPKFERDEIISLPLQSEEDELLPVEDGMGELLPPNAITSGRSPATPWDKIRPSEQKRREERALLLGIPLGVNTGLGVLPVNRSLFFEGHRSVSKKGSEASISEHAHLEAHDDLDLQMVDKNESKSASEASISPRRSSLSSH